MIKNARKERCRQGAGCGIKGARASRSSRVTEVGRRRPTDVSWPSPPCAGDRDGAAPDDAPRGAIRIPPLAGRIDCGACAAWKADPCRPGEWRRLIPRAGRTPLRALTNAYCRFTKTVSHEQQLFRLGRRPISRAPEDGARGESQAGWQASGQGSSSGTGDKRRSCIHHAFQTHPDLSVFGWVFGPPYPPQAVASPRGKGCRAAYPPEPRVPPPGTTLPSGGDGSSTGAGVAPSVPSPIFIQSSPHSSIGCWPRSVPFPQRMSSAAQSLSQPQQMRSG